MLADRDRIAIAGRVRVCLGYAEQLRKAQTKEGFNRLVAHVAEWCGLDLHDSSVRAEIERALKVALGFQP